MPFEGKIYYLWHEDSNETEEFRELPGYPNYYASNFGYIRNERLGKNLKGSDIRKDIQVTLRGADGLQHHESVDRLIASVFLYDAGPGMYVKHLDGNYRNNNANNLIWKKYRHTVSNDIDWDWCCDGPKWEDTVIITPTDTGYIADYGYNETEEFCRINGYPDYSVSNKGNIRNERFGKFLSPVYCPGGYRVKLMNYRGERKAESVSRLVAKAFVDGELPDYIVKHVDGNDWNNNSNNLEWVPRIKKNGYEE